MKFCWSKIDVVNMDDSVKFYNEVIGLDIISRFKPTDNFEITFLGTADTETKIELVCDSTKEKVVNINGVSLGFEVESLDKTMQSFSKSGIEIEAGPITPNPTVTFLYIRDPNGVQLQIIEQLKK